MLRAFGIGAGSQRFVVERVQVAYHLTLSLCELNLRKRSTRTRLVQPAYGRAPVPDWHRKIHCHKVTEVGQLAELRLRDVDTVKGEPVGLDAVDRVVSECREKSLPRGADLQLGHFQRFG